MTNQGGTIGVLRGFNPTSQGIDLQAPLGGCCGYHPALGLDAAGRLWVAWYSNATGNTGIYVQQLDPSTGGPIGAAAKVPNSETVYNNSFDTALVCAATCRVVYGGPATQIESWAPGESGPTVIAKVPPNAVAGRVVTAAYRSDGKLWVAWWDRSTYRYTLGDATGKGGQALDAGLPVPAAGFNGNAFALSSLAVGNDSCWRRTGTTRSPARAWPSSSTASPTTPRRRRRPRPARAT